MSGAANAATCAQISRSFGDAAFKKLGCIATPDVTAFPLTPRDAFMLLGCDGFWGVSGARVGLA
jgi:integrin-linked kinase-associated serine/threonine phosphatase 2C